LPIPANALTLWEANYSPVQYIPLSDVDTSSLLQRTDHYTYCPYKGECSHYPVLAGGPRTVNAVWTYEAPYEAVAAIKDHAAFHLNHVEISEAVPTA